MPEGFLIETASYIQNWRSLAAFSQVDRYYYKLLSDPRIESVLWAPSFKYRYSVNLPENVVFSRSSKGLFYQRHLNYRDALSRHLPFNANTHKGLKSDREFVLAKFQEPKGGVGFKYAAPGLQADKSIAMAALTSAECGWKSGVSYTVLRHTSNTLRADSDVLAFTIKHHFTQAVTYLSDEIKGDRKKMLGLIKLDYRSYQYASDELKLDSDFLIAAMKKSLSVICYAPSVLLNDDELMRGLISKYSLPLQYASDTLKNDRPLVVSAVRKLGYLFKHISPQLRGDQEIALIALEQTGNVYEYVSDELKQNREFILQAISLKGSLLRFLSEDYRNDEDVVFSAIKDNSSAAKFASSELKDNFDFIFKVLKLNGGSLSFLSKKIKTDPAFKQALEIHKHERVLPESEKPAKKACFGFFSEASSSSSSSSSSSAEIVDDELEPAIKRVKLGFFPEAPLSPLNELEDISFLWTQDEINMTKSEPF